VLKLLPLIVFFALAGFLARGLMLDPSRLPSPLIDKPAPALSVNTLPATDQPFTVADLQDQVWVLNVFASWCVACVAEHPVLVQMAALRSVPLIGLNYKDQPDDATAWLSRFGNPYQQVLDDRDGRAGLDWGVYGVPETFIIDRAGRVRYKHIGPIEADQLESVFLPILDELLAAST